MRRIFQRESGKDAKRLNRAFPRGSVGTMQTHQALITNPPTAAHRTRGEFVATCTSLRYSDVTAKRPSLLRHQSWSKLSNRQEVGIASKRTIRRSWLWRQHRWVRRTEIQLFRRQKLAFSFQNGCDEMTHARLFRVTFREGESRNLLRHQFLGGCLARPPTFARRFGTGFWFGWRFQLGVQDRQIECDKVVLEDRLERLLPNSIQFGQFVFQHLLLC